jgi:tetratricopeptide (TPR) repeat protein
MMDKRSSILLTLRFFVLLAVPGAVLLAASTSQRLDKAEELYQRTDYQGSLALIDKNTQDAAANFLIARNYFMQGEFKQATDFFLKATEEQPNNSDYMDWLGRVYGRRAETSSFLTAPSFASKAREAFERAVELNPSNKDALADLFDYYLNAPGFMGGGYDKASAVAQRTVAIDPPEAYYEKAKLAEKRKQYSSEEEHLRQAVAAAPHQVGHLVTLAKFLANQGRTQESDQVFQQAETVNPNAPSVWYAHADILIKQKRDLDQARSLLQKYLSTSLTPDDPPKQEAARLLKQASGA